MFPISVYHFVLSSRGIAMRRKKDVFGREYGVLSTEPRVVFEKDRMRELSEEERKRIIEEDKQSFEERVNYIEYHDDYMFEAYETEYTKIVRKVYI